MTPSEKDNIGIEFSEVPGEETLSCKFILPHNIDGNTVQFIFAGMQSLSDYLQYVSENDFVYLSYCLAKAIQEFSVFGSKDCDILLDQSMIFFDKETDCWFFVPTEEKNKFNSLKNFYLGMVFGAVFDEKKLKSVKELFEFVRLSSAISAQDIIMMIEMAPDGGNLKKRYLASFSESHTESSGNIVDKGESYAAPKEQNIMSASSAAQATDNQQGTAFEDMEDFLFDGLDLTETLYSPPVNTSANKDRNNEPISKGSSVGVPSSSESDNPTKGSAVNIPLVDKAGSDSENNSVSNPDKTYDTRLSQIESEGSQTSGNKSEKPAHVGNEAKKETVSTKVEKESSLKSKKAILIDSAGSFIEIGGSRFVIGRQSKLCNHTIKNPSVSRQHAVIIKEGGDYYVSDLNSKNKTRLNGTVLSPEEYYVIEDGDIITLGIEDLAFRILEE